MASPSRSPLLPDWVRTWSQSPPRASLRSLEVVRVGTAFLLAVHAVYAFLHPGEMGRLTQLLASRSLPWPAGLAWGAVLLQGLSSLALLAPRTQLLGAAGHLVVLASGIGLTGFTHWFTVGGAAENGIPGIEFNVMLGIALVGATWGARRSVSQGLDTLRVGVALVLILHPLHGIFDPVGLRGFGQGLERLGFPKGLLLVWATMLLQIGCSLALLARRFVRPAAWGHLFVLSMGIWIAHAPRWFVVGPGEEGMEYSLLLILCLAAVAEAHGSGPRPRAQGDLGRAVA